MKRRKITLAALAVPLLAGAAIAVPSATAQPAAPALSGKRVEYNVLTANGVDVRSAEREVRAAGGTVLRSNAAVGLLTVSAPENGFTERLASSDAVLSAAPTTTIGHAPTGLPAPPPDVVEKENTFDKRSASKKNRKAKQRRADAPGMDPLDSQLWGLNAVRANLARDKQTGDHRVLVGVLDTGIDGSHPDIAPNFNRRLSRNFTVDIPYDELGQEVDGPCEFRGCVDPADHDDGGHGSHVAGTIAASADGFGVSGVAPDVSLVNIRGGQDSGYFFLQPVVDALTYAGDVGIDVVNMSFYVDPWLYNCTANPADSPEARAQQQTIIVAMSRAMEYAHSKGVSQIVALGNQHTDLGSPQPDPSSPDYPAGTAYDREIDNNTCLSMPVEGPHAISVSSYGPSQAKAAYSNYGLEQISVSAPGGWYRDYFGTPWFRTNENMILSVYPKNVGIADGAIDEDGNITPEGEAAGVQKACKPDGTCAYYAFSQGTSMAAPHASGVAALIVSEYGKFRGNKARMSPDTVQRVLEGTAREIACPVPPTVDYIDEGRPADWTATCEGDLEFNGFYGHGSVDALSAVVRGHEYL